MSTGMLNVRADIASTGQGPPPFSARTPIYEVFSHLDTVGAAFTGKGTSRANYYFSFQRSGIAPLVLAENIQSYAQVLGFSPFKVTWPNGSWPHSGQTIIAEHYDWVPARSGLGIVPLHHGSGSPVTYDGIATASSEFVLGVQGADCPSLFLCDPKAGVIGAAHSGWKPTVRGVATSIVKDMVSLGASPQEILAFVSPGVGDRFNEFSWDEAMEFHIRNVFVEAGREDILVDRSLRYIMGEEDRKEVRAATGRDIRSGVAFTLSALIARELRSLGVVASNIEVSSQSTICDRYTDESGYRYHSARRDAGKDPERPGFGSSLCVLFLKEGLSA
jgi:copper oxidase (laccase) domain-containing protein